MEKSRLAQKEEKLLEREKINNVRTVELEQLAEQLKVIEDSKGR